MNNTPYYPELEPIPNSLLTKNQETTMEHRKRPTRAASLPPPSTSSSIPPGTNEVETKVHRRPNKIRQLRRLVGSYKSRPSCLPLTMVIMGGLIVAYGFLSHRFLLDLPGGKTNSDYLFSERVFHQIIPIIVTASAGSVEKEMFLPTRPRKIGFYFETSDSNSFIGTERMDPNVIHMFRSHAALDISYDAVTRQKLLGDSSEYRQQI
jgi:hypothetical protein